MAGTAKLCQDDGKGKGREGRRARKKPASANRQEKKRRGRRQDEAKRFHYERREKILSCAIIINRKRISVMTIIIWTNENEGRRYQDCCLDLVPAHLPDELTPNLPLSFLLTRFERLATSSSEQFHARFKKMFILRGTTMARGP